MRAQLLEHVVEQLQLVLDDRVLQRTPMIAARFVPASCEFGAALLPDPPPSPLIGHGTSHTARWTVAPG